MKITCEISLPDDLARECLQHIRDFDTKHDPKHEGVVKMYITTESSHTVEEMTAILDTIQPLPEFRQTFCR